MEPISISFPSGSTYYGGFVDKHREGLGEHRNVPAGASYRGVFRRGQRHGLGALVSSTTGTRYFGEFEADDRHGLGVLVWPSGSFYIGSWARGVKEGLGSMAWVDRGERYVGGWKAGAPHGEGVHLWYDMEASGLASGGAKPGVASALGLHVTLDGSDGLPAPAEAAAEHTGLDEGGEGDADAAAQRWAMLENIDDGGAAAGAPFVGKRVVSMYKGGFEGGKRAGFGTFLYASGALYMGYWQGNLKHGPGIFIAADGQVFGGVFVNDRPVDPAGLGAGSVNSSRRSARGGGTSEAGGSDHDGSGTDTDGSAAPPASMAAEAAALAAAVASSQAYEAASAAAAAAAANADTAAGPLISGSSPLYTLRIDDLVPRDDLLLQQHVTANGRVEGVVQTVLSRLRAAAVQNVDVVMLRWNSFLRGWYSTYATLGQSGAEGSAPSGAAGQPGPAPLRGVALLARPITEGVPRSPEEAEAWAATGDAILSDDDVATFGWAASAVEMMLVEGMETYRLRLERDYRTLAGGWEAGGDLCGAAPAGGGNASGSRLPPVMRLHQLWAFAQDTGLTLPPSLSLAAVDDLLLTVRIQQTKAGLDAVRRLTPFAAAVARLVPGGGSSTSGSSAPALPPLLAIGQGLLKHLSHAVAHAHDPFRPVLFREFVEVLVRLAHARFVTTGCLPAPYDAPEAVSATDYGNRGGGGGGRPSSSASGSGASVAESGTHALTPRPVLGSRPGGLDAEGLPLTDLLESEHESDASGTSSSESDSEQPLLGAATTASIVALAAQRGPGGADAGASAGLGGRRGGGSLVSMGPGPSMTGPAGAGAPAPQPSLMGSRISINGVIVRKGDSRYFVPSTATGATSRLALARPTRRVPALGSLDELAYVCECMFWYHVAPHARGTADAAATLAKRGPRSARPGARRSGAGGGSDASVTGSRISEAGVGGGGSTSNHTRDASASAVSVWRGTAHSAASVASTAAHTSPRSAADSVRYAPGGSLASASAMTHTSRFGGRLPPFSAFGRSAGKRRARAGLPELTGGLDAGTASVAGGVLTRGGRGGEGSGGGIRGPWMDPALDPIRPVVYLGGDLLRPVAGAAGGAPALDALAEATQARQSALRILSMLMQTLLPSTLARVCAGAASPGPAANVGLAPLSLRALLAMADRHILAAAPSPSSYPHARGGFGGGHSGEGGSSAVTATRSPSLSASVCALAGVDRAAVDTDTFLGFLESDTGTAVDPLAPLKPVPAGVLLQILEQAGGLEATGISGVPALAPRAPVIAAPEPPAPEAPRPPSAAAAKLSKQQLAEAAEAAARAEAAAAAKAEAAVALHRETVAFAESCPAVTAVVGDLNRLLSECPGFTLRTAAEALAKTLCPYPLQHEAESALPIGLAGSPDGLVVGGRVVPLSDLLQVRLVASEVAEALLRLTVARADCRARRAAWLRTAASRLSDAAAQGARDVSAAVASWVAARRANLEAAAAAAAAASSSRPQTAASGKSAPAAKPATAGKGSKPDPAAEAAAAEEQAAAQKAAAAAEDAALTTTLCGALGVVVEDLAAQAREALAAAAAAYRLPPPFARSVQQRHDGAPASPGGSSLEGSMDFPAPTGGNVIPPSPGAMSTDFPDMRHGEGAASPRSHAELLVANPDDVLLGLVEPAVPFLPLSGLQQQDVLAKIRSGTTSLLEAVEARLEGGVSEQGTGADELGGSALLLLASPKRSSSPPPSRSSPRGGAAGASPLRSPLKSPNGLGAGVGKEVLSGDGPLLSPPRGDAGVATALSPGAASVASTVEESNAYGDDFDED